MSELFIVLFIILLWVLGVRWFHRKWAAFGDGRADAVERVDDPGERRGTDRYFYRRGRSKAPRRSTQEHHTDLTN